MVRIDRVAADPPARQRGDAQSMSLPPRGNAWTCLIPMPPTGDENPGLLRTTRTRAVPLPLLISTLYLELSSLGLGRNLMGCFSPGNKIWS